MTFLSEWSKRWPSFHVEEILSQDQLALFTNRGVFPYSFRALDKLQSFRGLVGAPLIVNKTGSGRRGARSIEEVVAVNKSIRGVSPYSYSFHLWCAFDISCSVVRPVELRQIAIESKLWGGIGIYDTWLHCDDRDFFGDTPTLWDGRSRK